VKLSGAIPVVSYLFQQWDRCALHFQAVQVEGHRKQRAAMEVHQMAAKQVAAEDPSRLQDLSPPVVQGHHFYADSTEVIQVGDSGIQHSLAARQNLRPTICCPQIRYPHRRAASGGNPRQTGSARERSNDAAVFAPTAAYAKRSVAEGKRRATLHGYFFQ